MPPEEERQPAEMDWKKERANLKKVGLVHFLAVMAALTLWGAADSWASVSGWWLARAAAVINAIIAATVIAGIVHEWGHYTGARLAGSVTRAFKKPAGYFFIFDFPFDANDSRQFLSMSWGGILAPWLLVLLIAASVPIDNPSRAMLVAVLVMRAAQASFFEIPVVLRTAGGGDPKAELERRLGEGALATSRYAGGAVGVLAYLAI